VYLPYVMLRNLAPGGMTAAEQRAADEQLGRIVAAVARRRRRVAARAESGSRSRRWLKARGLTLPADRRASAGY
jgi:hypothetical protein